MIRPSDPPGQPHRGVVGNDRPAEEIMAARLQVVASVTGDAIKSWERLWRQLKPSTTENLLVLPSAENGFKPESGWAEFLEEFWLLKHYLDFTGRFCQQAGHCQSSPPQHQG